jgi:general secretion pathway protein I
MTTTIGRFGSKGGFTLLEVVVALTIVALGVVTVLEIFSLGLRLAAKSSELSQARLYGQSVMDEIMVYGGPQSGREEGYFSAGHRWRLQVRTLGEPAASLANPWELKEIGLELRYREANREKQLELKTLRLSKRTNS